MELESDVWRHDSEVISIGRSGLSIPAHSLPSSITGRQPECTGSGRPRSRVKPYLDWNGRVAGAPLYPGQHGLGTVNEIDCPLVAEVRKPSERAEVLSDALGLCE